MELEEAINELTFQKEYLCDTYPDKRLKQAIEIVLQALDNSISKKKIEHDLKVCQSVYEKEMKPYQTEYGLDVTYLSKKEKNELINKRNCLITQMETYKRLLEDK